MKTLTCVLLGLLLAACATEAKYQKVLNALQGTDELSLIRRWGPPDHVYESHGHRFLMYRRDQTAFMPGAEPVYRTTLSGNTAYTHGYGGYPPTIITLFCATTFEIVEDKIVGSSHRGNNCVSN